ncbi:MAG: dihydroorotate dehydrogenase electron transfer subunit [Candidatus Bathyarchaeia archaeon]
MSAWLTAVSRLRTTRIEAIKTESPTVKVFSFKDRLCARAKPGQFLMLWVPGVDEIPLSILEADKNGTVSVAVKKVGEATRALHSMKAGGVVGVRGPFGNSFTEKSGRILMVGGGTGIAPLIFLVRRLKSTQATVKFVIGAKTRAELLFLDQLYTLCGRENVLTTTEDGSHGVKGLVTHPLEQLMEREIFDMIYTCGPEKMMLEVFRLSKERGIPMEASLERIMRCAIGICGSCTIGRYRVCKDGPVFNINQLRNIVDEFGFWKRDFSGKKIPVQ